MMDTWPDIPFKPWKETCATLHLWLQIVGKYRLRRTPWINHGWHATFYVTARGLTTSLIPADNLGVQFDFDFVSHQLIGTASDGSVGTITLEPMPVADFYARFRAMTGGPGCSHRNQRRAKRSAGPGTVRTRQGARLL
ncbi:MAG TPA: DUF5996 family protein [Hyphomicrobium sp.]